MSPTTRLARKNATPRPEMQGADVQVKNWLNALPHAAAIIHAGAPKPALLCANHNFHQLAISCPFDEDDNPLCCACLAVLEGREERVTLLWEQNGFAGRVFEASIAPLSGIGAEPAILLSLIDRTTLTRSEANLRRELLSDSLTGLPNRSGFGDLLEERMRNPAPSGQPQTLLIVDMLRFSRINESIGALAGDELLLTVAKRLSGQVRAGDILGRIGGDEFAILGGTRGGEAGARRMAARIRRAFEQPFRIGELLINVDCAVGGIAELGHAHCRDGCDAPELIRQALIALKQAKQADGVAFYEPVALARLHQRFDRETALRSAIIRDEITLAFQPLVDMKRRRIIGFEALARWTLDGQPISPAEFVPIAEDSGLIVPLGRRVIERALATLADWDSRYGKAVPIHVAVNVSPIQLARDDIVAVVQSAMARAGVDGRRLMIEVTESSVVENPEAAGAILRALAALDVRIAMDDFGTGYSNIANLQRLPINTLKIDRSLISGIDSSADSLAIVRTIQRLGEALGMKTTAEGIESEAVAGQVAAIGCNTGQGYLFSRPLEPDAAFTAWAASYHRQR
ncbi:MAG: bifunctional diguanylate cyclase/phosphodiesterase [Sphingopyxis sp.]